MHTRTRADTHTPAHQPPTNVQSCHRSRSRSTCRHPTTPHFEPNLYGPRAAVPELAALHQPSTHVQSRRPRWQDVRHQETATRKTQYSCAPAVCTSLWHLPPQHAIQWWSRPSCSWQANLRCCCCSTQHTWQYHYGPSRSASPAPPQQQHPTHAQSCRHSHLQQACRLPTMLHSRHNLYGLYMSAAPRLSAQSRSWLSCPLSNLPSLCHQAKTWHTAQPLCAQWACAAPLPPELFRATWDATPWCSRLRCSWQAWRHLC